MTASDLVNQASDVITRIEAFLQIFICAICSEKVQDARICPQCSYAYCHSCFERSLRDCSSKCPHCYFSLTENQLVHVRWLDDLTELLTSARAVLHTVNLEVEPSPAAPVNEPAIAPIPLEPPMPREAPNVPESPTYTPLFRCAHSVSRHSYPFASGNTWHVLSLQWSRIHSDLFYAGFGNDNYTSSFAFGLFTVDPADHPGCFVKTAGIVISIDVYPTKPDLVCVAMREGFKGVALYQLRTGKLPTADLSSVEGQRLFGSQFACSSSEFSFDMMWKLSLTETFWSVMWQTELMILVQSEEKVSQLTMENFSSTPNVKVLDTPDEGDKFKTMSLQQDSEPLLPNQTATKDTRCDCSQERIAVGTSKGYIKIYSLSPDFKLKWSWSNAHTGEVLDVSWCPLVPNLLASASRDKQLKIWTPGYSQPLITLEFANQVWRFCWSPLSSTVIAVLTSWDQLIHLFDLSLDRKKALVEIEKNDLGARNRLAFHPSRPWLLVGHQK